MRRLIYLFLLAAFVSASVSSVNASTDCQRWFVAYRQQLAHSQHLQRVAAVRRRAQLYARRKLAGFLRPTPKRRPAAAGHPRMTRKQALRHLEIACGVLPEPEGEMPMMAEETPAEFSGAAPSGNNLDLMPADMGDLMAENRAPAQPFLSGSQDPGNSASPMGAAFAGAGGGGGSYIPAGDGAVTPLTDAPPSTASSSPGSGGASDPPPGLISTPPSSPPPADPPSQSISESHPIPPPPAVVPEPSSVVFVLTGLGAAASTLRRRRRAAGCS